VRPETGLSLTAINFHQLMKDSRVSRQNTPEIMAISSFIQILLNNETLCCSLPGFIFEVGILFVCLFVYLTKPKLKKRME
jgi:hypothetical protein